MRKFTKRSEDGNLIIIGANMENWEMYLEVEERENLMEAIKRLAEYEETDERAELASNHSPAEVPPLRRP